MKGWLYFVWFLVVDIVVMVIGWVLLAPFSLFKLWTVKYNFEFPGRPLPQWRGGKLMFVWGNLEDGVVGSVRYQERIPNKILSSYLWSAWRNSANNLRFVFRWVGGPFYRKEWRQWYFQCGWYDNGFPVISAGRIQPVGA
jgi:hypothetical protein